MVVGETLPGWLFGSPEFAECRAGRHRRPGTKEKEFTQPQSQRQLLPGGKAILKPFKVQWKISKCSKHGFPYRDGPCYYGHQSLTFGRTQPSGKLDPKLGALA
jgi:hypothetical protein